MSDLKFVDLVATQNWKLVGVTKDTKTYLDEMLKSLPDTPTRKNNILVPVQNLKISSRDPRLNFLK